MAWLSFVVAIQRLTIGLAQNSRPQGFPREDDTFCLSRYSLPEGFSRIDSIHIVIEV